MSKKRLIPFRVPTAPPGKAHTSKKGARGYNRSQSHRMERQARRRIGDGD